MSSTQPTNRMADVEAQQPEQVPMQTIDLQSAQPPSFQPMNPQKPHPEGDVSLRGGDRGGMCPGRFCFIIPCPLPCDFCII
ncbi:hypothetical protein DL546_002943 [Coniochaeta pulveracea]|uniref:Uncharacterized protein n=1 Tax=Coniochaeta pulveracea TaxID=177199 RepID=A0A420Y115_9PEZI|nr:hypothetical protein DL546_002943 [Coniochaeta pulveracea]